MRVGLSFVGISDAVQTGAAEIRWRCDGDDDDDDDYSGDCVGDDGDDERSRRGSRVEEGDDVGLPS